MNRALLIIDLQNGVCNSPTFFNRADLLSTVNQQIAEYRKKKLPIIFIQHEDEELIYNSPSWQLVSELDANPTDIYIRKTHANSFYQTTLQATLKDNNVTELEIMGAQTQYCVDATIKFAHGLGYKIYSRHLATSTTDNSFMKAIETVHFYEAIWKDRFVTFYNL